ncbi:hypothetical protein GCM10012320_08100 [Sinomonas cellulolyticus]|uniref:YaaC-like Protein n=1 Tax=Sinomonas cellulolyticus TaxID=2801916 RepID=A0ABS1K3L8_9MICC|nr:MULTISPECIES: hypothetical protein [Sinomonas]MBL0706275.1 hypothetical protein [Sinomonas cellulolyticus]GHG43802.1 hypothetical protein GCM10012320_08100 [Sinomonas sp. KCTC 49339]
MVTYAELQARPLREIWQELRSLRSRGVGNAAKGARRATFDAALEQAEQLFTAATIVGTATQPILLFYGLCQLGRGLAAASTRLTNSEYRLSGHGLTDKALQDAATHGLSQVTVQALNSGAFPTVARALGCSPMNDAIPLGDLWDLLPYSDRFPLRSRGRLQRLILDSESTHLLRGQDEARVRLYPLPLELHSTVTNAAAGSDVVDDASIAEEYELLQQFLQSYPTLSGWSSTNTHGQPIPYQQGFYEEERYLQVPLRLPKEPGQSEGRALEARSVDYHGVHYVYPRLDSTDLPAHPFMLWWALLFVLSRLARYQPNEWLTLTSVSQSEDAVPIEYILGEAMRAVPELALQAVIRDTETT